LLFKSSSLGLLTFADGFPFVIRPKACATSPETSCEPDRRDDRKTSKSTFASIQPFLTCEFSAESLSIIEFVHCVNALEDSAAKLDSKIVSTLENTAVSEDAATDKSCRISFCQDPFLAILDVVVQNENRLSASLGKS
jgi:hypothetical protein